MTCYQQVEPATLVPLANQCKKVFLVFFNAAPLITDYRFPHCFDVFQYLSCNDVFICPVLHVNYLIMHGVQTSIASLKKASSLSLITLNPKDLKWYLEMIFVIHVCEFTMWFNKTWQNGSILFINY